MRCESRQPLGSFTSLMSAVYQEMPAADGVRMRRRVGKEGYWKRSAWSLGDGSRDDRRLQQMSATELEVRVGIVLEESSES